MECSPTFTFLSLIIISITFLVQQGLGGAEEAGGISCYVCNSRSDPRCGHPFQKKHFNPVNCSDLNYLDIHQQELMKKNNRTVPNVCRKNYQTVTLGGRTDTRIVRKCGFLPKNKPVDDEADDGTAAYEDTCYRKTGTYEVSVTYCTCTKSDCNGVESNNNVERLAIVGSLSIFIIYNFFVIEGRH